MEKRKEKKISRGEPLILMQLGSSSEGRNLIAVRWELNPLAGEDEDTMDVWYSPAPNG